MKLIKTLGLLVMPTVLMTGCGDSSLGRKFDLKLDPAKQTASLEIEMGDGLEVSMEGGYQLPDNLGNIHFVKATRSTNAKIAVEFNLWAAIPENLVHFEMADKLPSGAPLPVAMTPSLFKIKAFESKDFKVSAMFALSPELQVGAMVDIAAFSSRYVPNGISVCQNFRNSDKLAVAAICLYGPSATNSGGIFIGGNFGAVLPENNIISSASSIASLTSTKSASQVLDLNPVAMSSQDSENIIFDPKRKLTGSNGVKAYRNVEKVLRVRR